MDTTDSKKKRRRALLAALIAASFVVFVGVFCWWASPPPDRLFRGKLESDWIQHLSYRDEPQVNQWREFGPEGVQVLIRALGKANHPFERAYRRAYRWMLPFAARFMPAPRMDSSRVTRMNVVDLLSRLSKDASMATPVMVRELADESEGVRAIALTFFTQGEDQNTLLNHLEMKEKQRLLPRFIAAMEDADSSVRNNAALALRYYPEQSQAVTPVLIKALKDSVPHVAEVAAKSLKIVDPEAAAKAGVK